MPTEIPSCRPVAPGLIGQLSDDDTEHGFGRKGVDPNIVSYRDIIKSDVCGHSM